MALRSRRINNFIDFPVIAWSGAMGIWLLTLRFHKSDIGWPPQPLKERMPNITVYKFLRLVKNECRFTMKERLRECCVQMFRKSETLFGLNGLVRTVACFLTYTRLVCLKDFTCLTKHLALINHTSGISVYKSTCWNKQQSDFQNPWKLRKWSLKKLSQKMAGGVVLGSPLL